jgi:3-oxoacyl-(acyl-carrier-protein) synthase
MISPIGNSVQANRVSLKEGKCGIAHLAEFPSRYAALLPFGEVKLKDTELREILQAPESRLTRTTLLALHAFRDAILDSDLSASQLSSHETAFIGASTVGGMCLTDELYQDANLLTKGSSYLSSYDSASVFLHLQSRYKMKGVINTINTACSSSANAIAFGARLIKNGLAKRAIVGGADSLAKFTINGFNSLMILSSEHCTPFDRDRKGLNLGEGACFLVLEREEDCEGKRIYGELSGYSNTNDAFHPSSLSDNGQGPYSAMNEALKIAQLEAKQIDYINAHGTGTENNDVVESTAMIQLFGPDIPFSSTKSNTGHTLGAASAIEAAYCLLNLTHQELYPSLHFQHPIPETNLTPVLSYLQQPLQHVMSNSFGFGGNCSSLIFSKN